MEESFAATPRTASGPGARRGSPHHQPPLHQGRLQARELVVDLDRAVVELLDIDRTAGLEQEAHAANASDLPPDQTQSNVAARGSAKLQSDRLLGRPFLGGEIMESSGRHKG